MPSSELIYLFLVLHVSTSHFFSFKFVCPGIAAGTSRTWMSEGPGSSDGNRVGALPEFASLMPLTIRMLIDAHATDRGLLVNGKEVTLCTFVAQIEAVHERTWCCQYRMNDSTGRIAVRLLHGEGVPSARERLAAEYVRVVGVPRDENHERYVSALHIAPLADPNELSFHFVEVAHVHLSLTAHMRGTAQLQTRTIMARDIMHCTVEDSDSSLSQGYEWIMQINQPRPSGDRADNAVISPSQPVTWPANWPPW